MTEKEQDAYNEWLLLWGFAEVSSMKIDNSLMGALPYRIALRLIKKASTKGNKIHYQLKQPHEIT